MSTEHFDHEAIQEMVQQRAIRQMRAYLRCYQCTRESYIQRDDGRRLCGPCAQPPDKRLGTV